MVSPSRSSIFRRRRDDAGKMAVGVLIVLGLVASIFLVFSESVEFVRVGLVAALWAAVIGALAATRYRKEASIDKAKVRDLQTVYELQLEREVTARREHEAGVEARVREEVGADVSDMAALRSELTMLRESLQRLFDGELPMDRTALRAPATRVRELHGSAAGLASEPLADTEGGAQHPTQQPRSAITPIFDPDHPQRPRFADPLDDPVTAETAAVQPTQSGGWADAFAEDDQAPPRLSAPDDQPGESASAMETGAARRRRRVDTDTDTDADNASRRLSVAEIMANLQSEEKAQPR